MHEKPRQRLKERSQDTVFRRFLTSTKLDFCLLHNWIYAKGPPAVPALTRLADISNVAHKYCQMLIVHIYNMYSTLSCSESQHGAMTFFDPLFISNVCKVEHH